MANKILVVGCGDLGTAVAQKLVHLGFDVYGLKRSTTSIVGVEIIQADVTQPQQLRYLAYLAPQIIIYCVAAKTQSDVAYQAAYVDGLRNVLATQANNHDLKHVFFVSSTRVYGQETDALLDETTPAHPADFGGQRLLEAESLLQGLACPSTVLRLSGIYGANRLRMLHLAQAPHAWPAVNSWSNRIHRDDAAAFMVYLITQLALQQAIAHCYIVTDSQPVSQYEVLTWLAQQLGVHAIPQFVAPSAGKRLSNQAMLAAGFKLQYPDYRAGYQSLLSQDKPQKAIA